jgi:predicted alpha/beta superfamily hydrolase
MPRTIVVGIPNTNRNRDLTPTKGILGRDSSMYSTSGGGPKFLDFIVSELTPYIDSLYSTSTHRTIIGHSLGGLIVFEALLRRREHFNNYLAIDPGLFYDNESYYHQVLDSLRSANLSEENLFIAKGNSLPTFLDIEDIEKDTSEIVKLTKTNEDFLKLSRSENWNINYIFKKFPTENHFSIPYPATYEAMKYFYSYYPFREMMDYYHPAYKDKTDLVVQLKKHYQLISNQLAYEVLPMESYINSWAYGFSHFQRVDLALDLFNLNIELYPENASVYNPKEREINKPRLLTGYFVLPDKNAGQAIFHFENAHYININSTFKASFKITKK